MNPHALRFGIVAAAVTLAGIVLSGPLGIALVEATHPQPSWSGAAEFARAYHPVQTLPYFFGFLLDGGSVALIACLHALAPRALKARTGAALALAAAFAAMIFFNYALQTSFVPALARELKAGDEAIVSALSMSNPKSFAWALEMWGYAVLGVATWLAAPVFAHGRLERVTAALFAANGPVSIAGGLWTAAQPGWVLTRPGIVAFVGWNALMIAMVALALVALKLREGAPAAHPTVAHA